jgi:hypothetical protein
MLLCAVNRSQPAFTSRNPQFITRREVRRRIVEGADSKFNLVDAVHARKQRRTAHGAKVTAVGGVSPASSLARHRYFVRRPDRKDVANRARLLSTQEAVAEADAKGFPADLKPHFTAIAAACSLWHISLPLRTNDSVLLEALHATTRSVAGIVPGGRVAYPACGRLPRERAQAAELARGHRHQPERDRRRLPRVDGAMRRAE